MEIKVLGTGCAGCRALYETTKQAITELGCDVVLIKEEDLLKIMEYNVLSYEETLLFTILNHYLNILW